ncbi:MAG: hypothetical protein V3S08_07115 [Phycisphaerales bacterium]
MKYTLPTILAGSLLLSIATTAFAGATIEIRLQNGSRWSGELQERIELTYRQGGVEIKTTATLVRTADYFITVETEVAGEIRRQTIFKDDIIRLRTIRGSGDEVMDVKGARPKHVRSKSNAGAGDTKGDGTRPGVFVLPLKGTVGIEFRHDEIEKIAEEADKYGSGQIIVLVIDSGGGLITEMETIHETMTTIKKRHRLVAWVKKAISAACATAMHCDEIYFMTNGTAGAMTAFKGTKSWSGDELELWLTNAGDWMESGGRSRYIAEAMIHNSKLLSYDKDADTGEVTFYNDLSGETILSRTSENLVFNATNALDCGFSDGTASNEQELAELLDLGEWYEISDYGRRIAKDWQDVVERGQRELRLLQERLSYAGTGSGDPVEILGNRIKIYEKFLRWKDRCPPCTMGMPPKEDIQRQISEMRRDLAKMKKRRRY